MNFFNNGPPDLVNTDKIDLPFVEQQIPENENLTKFKVLMYKFYVNYIEPNLIILILLVIFVMIFLYLYIVHTRKQKYHKSKRNKTNYHIVKTKPQQNKDVNNNTDNEGFAISSLSEIGDDPDDLINSPFDRSTVINKKKYETKQQYDDVIPQGSLDEREKFEIMSKQLW